MNNYGKITGIAILAVLSIQAFAADVTGKWTGKIEVDMATVKAQMAEQMKKMTPEQKKQAEAGLQMGANMMKTMVFNLTIVKGGKYTMVTPAMGPNAKPKTESGTWKLNGNKLTMSDPNAKQGPKSITGTVSANGKTMVFDLTSSVAKQVPAGAGKPPKTTLTFTKA